MKIDVHKTPENQGPTRNPQIQKPQSGESGNGAPGVQGAGKTGPADKVEISSRSKELADIMAAVDQLPDVREAKVQEIKKSVEAGTYTIDPRKIALKMLQEI